MIFNCKHCSARIEKNDDGEWVAVESKPIPVKEEAGEPSVEYLMEEPETQEISELIYNWSDKVVLLGWCLIGFYILIAYKALFIGFQVTLSSLINILLTLFFTYLLRDLLRALSKHLENQKKILVTLEKD